MRPAHARGGDVEGVAPVLDVHVHHEVVTVRKELPADAVSSGMAPALRVSSAFSFRCIRRFSFACFRSLAMPPILS
jgi:hypothetical protein